MKLKLSPKLRKKPDLDISLIGITQPETQVRILGLPPTDQGSSHRAGPSRSSSLRWSTSWEPGPA